MKIDYAVNYSNRRTISLKIDESGALTVSCPYGTASEKIERFVYSKRGWIEKYMSEISRRNGEWAEIINFKKILICGKAYDFTFGDGNYFDDKIVVTNQKKLRYVFVENFSAEFLKRYKCICACTGLKAQSVGFKDYKSMWGCCDNKNNIIFNYKVMMLPTNLQAYVIVHELCHTLRHDHSKLFWKYVENFLPDFKLSIKQMKEYAFITRLY